MRSPVIGFTVAQATAMGLVPSSVSTRRIRWNRFKYRFVAWITMGRVALPFTEYTPKIDDDQLPYEEVDETFPGVGPTSSSPSVDRPSHRLNFDAMPAPEPATPFSKTLDAMASCYRPSKAQKPTRRRPVKRGGSRSKFKRA